MMNFMGREGMVWWQGIIEDVKDPEALGRVRVRIIGYHTEDRQQLPTDALPWASPIMPITSAAIAGIGQSPTGALPGAWVMGFFRDGEAAQDPIIFGTVYGRPNDTSQTTEDGSYPSSDERVPGASTNNETDVNRLARGTGVSEESGGSGDANGVSDGAANTGDQTAHGKVDQDGTPSDSENKKRLSKITTKNGKSTYVATIFAENFQNFINELEKTPAPNHPNGYTIYSIGGYNHRKSAAGSGAWSYHASGASIDINPRENPYSSQFITDMPSNTSAIAAKYGLGWGGDWTSKKDTMHFSMASAERGSVKLKRNGVVPDPNTGSQEGSPSSSGSSSVYGKGSPFLGEGNTRYTAPQNQPKIQTQARPAVNAQDWQSGKTYQVGDVVKNPVLSKGQNSTGGPPHTMKSGIISSASALGISAVDLATVISYETAGTFNPRKPGPTTKWGQHKGLIQFGEPQATQYGVDFTTEQSAIDTQLGSNGAVVKYLRDAGVKPGMGRLEVYSAINAGGIGEKYYGRSDSSSGGAAGTVRDKVNNQMAGHEVKANRLLQGTDEAKFVEQTVFIARKAGISGSDGGPRKSNLTDGDVLWEVANNEIQQQSVSEQFAEAEAAAATTSDGYTTNNKGISNTPAENKPAAVQQKENSIDETDLFKEPDNPYAAEYPYNKVLFTESGHIQEFDDTPGAERIHTMHKSGTFQEIHPDGTTVTKVVKDNYQIVFGENNIYVKGNLNIVVDKDVNIKVSGAVDAQIGKTLNSQSGGNTTIKAPRIDLNP